MLPKTQVTPEENTAYKLTVVASTTKSLDPIFTDRKPQCSIRMLTSDEALTLPKSVIKKYFEEEDAILLEWNQNSIAMLLEFQQINSQLRTPLFSIYTTDETDKIIALRLGVDDNLEPPISFPLFIAKLQAYRRRQKNKRVPVTNEIHSPEKSLLELIDSNSHTLNYQADSVPLRIKELGLLKHLIKNKDKCCSREDILNRLWGHNFDTGTNILDVQIYALRKKIKRLEIPVSIETVRGCGYRLVATEKFK